MTWKLSGPLVSSLSAPIDLSKSRLETLAGLIVCPVNARTVNPTHIAARFSGTAETASGHRRRQRFFRFVSLDEDRPARAVIRAFSVKVCALLRPENAVKQKVGAHSVNRSSSNVL